MESTVTGCIQCYRPAAEVKTVAPNCHSYNPYPSFTPKETPLPHLSDRTEDKYLYLNLLIRPGAQTIYLCENRQGNLHHR